MDLARWLERIAEPSLEASAAIDAFEAWLRENVVPRTEPA
jgi:hypothetical protein